MVLLKYVKRTCQSSWKKLLENSLKNMFARSNFKNMAYGLLSGFIVKTSMNKIVEERYICSIKILIFETSISSPKNHYFKKQIIYYSLIGKY